MAGINWNMIEIYLKIFETNMCTVIEFFSIFFLQFLAESSYMPKQVTTQRSYSMKTGTSRCVFSVFTKIENNSASKTTPQWELRLHIVILIVSSPPLQYMFVMNCHFCNTVYKLSVPAAWYTYSTLVTQILAYRPA
jgi:hypothetical protein